MISPYVRRQRLAAELAALREAAGLTHAQLAKEIGQSRTKISRLENGHIRPNQAEILKILDVLGVEGELWSQLVDIASDAAERGWWASFGADMGARQAMYADLEAGAVTIREFQQPFIPGLLQTTDFTRQRSAIEGEIGPVAYLSERAVEARLTRQKMLRRRGGPAYEVVLDEIVVRRFSAPAKVMRAQLEHLVRLVAQDPSITVRVLPVDARISGYGVPRSAFSLYTYPDPGDPTVVAVDTVTSDLVLTTLSEAEQVERYVALYERLADASLSPDASVEFLTTTARQLPKLNGGA